MFGAQMMVGRRLIVQLTDLVEASINLIINNKPRTSPFLENTNKRPHHQHAAPHETLDL